MPVIRTLTKKLPLTEEDVKELLTGLINAVFYMHEHKIVHRDIKPDNIGFNDEGHAILMDFGTSTICEDPSLMVSDTQGTFAYWAPEVFTSQTFSGGGQDVWALGVTTFELLFGILPFGIQLNLLQGRSLGTACAIKNGR